MPPRMSSGGGVFFETVAANSRRSPGPTKISYANAAASGVTLSQDILDAIDGALGEHVVSDYRLAYGAQNGVKHR